MFTECSLGVHLAFKKCAIVRHETPVSAATSFVVASEPLRNANFVSTLAFLVGAVRFASTVVSVPQLLH